MGHPLVHRVPTLGHDAADLGLHPKVNQDPLALLEMLGAPGALAGRVEPRIFHRAVGVDGAAHHTRGGELPVFDLAREEAERPGPARRGLRHGPGHQEADDDHKEAAVTIEDVLRRRPMVAKVAYPIDRGRLSSSRQQRQQRPHLEVGLRMQLPF
jgi:hypothetical protein